MSLNSISNKNSSIIQTPNITSYGNNAPVFAKEGEPVYQKKMDLDNDGKITFDEFRQYCDENNISDYERQQLLDARAKWKLYSDAINSSDNKSENKLIYAKKGDLKYKDEMDYNSDNKITYEEYIKYCQKHKEEQKTKENEIEKTYNPENSEEETEMSVDIEV